MKIYVLLGAILQIKCCFIRSFLCCYKQSKCYEKDNDPDKYKICYSKIENSKADQKILCNRNAKDNISEVSIPWFVIGEKNIYSSLNPQQEKDGNAKNKINDEGLFNEQHNFDFDD
ncbi:hypothetical protein GVAV_002218 [Gurleya vavrai]